MDNLNFKGGNPGAVHYGNFINYYKFNPPDNRLKFFPEHIWDKSKPFIGLDIGCNCGDLTLSIHEFLKKHIQNNCRILGIDVDPILIERANEKNISTDISFETVDFMDQSKCNQVVTEYLKTNEVFTAVFCFSITMWIHLNHGDEGLRAFLERVCDLGEMIIIEPQPWKCYRTAVKRLKSQNEEFAQYKNIKLRENVEQTIEDIILSKQKHIKIFESDTTEWDRKIVIFKCKDNYLI